jgi:hypothetical protein
MAMSGRGRAATPYRFFRDELARRGAAVAYFFSFRDFSSDSVMDSLRVVASSAAKEQ